MADEQFQAVHADILPKSMIFLEQLCKKLDEFL